MDRLKNSALQSLALHCGYPGGTTKASRLAAVEQGARAARRLLENAPATLNVLSVDVGLKNFSFCKLSYNLASPAVAVHQWEHWNLHDRFGAAECKPELARLAVGVVDLVFVSSWVPHIVTIENQRTRSNSNAATLPNVLLNFTLEQMLYAAFAARQSTHPSLASTHLVPVNSNKMVSFWISRFVQTKFSGARSKRLRAELLYGWLANPQHAPFDLSPIASSLPSNFSALSHTKQNAALLQALHLDNPPKKVDDLVDCLLYNLACAKQLQRHRQLQASLDLEQLARTWDADHCSYLAPLVASARLELNPLYT